MDVAAEILERLAAWLMQHAAAPVRAAALQLERPSGGGWSNETLIVSNDGDPFAVLRLQPDGAAMFPNYDLGREYALLQALSKQTAVPTAPLLGADLDGELFGRPALVMGFVSGLVPSDDKPSFAEAGFLFHASPEVQRQFHVNLLSALTALHGLPSSMQTQLHIDDGAAGLVGALARLEAIWQWDRGARFPALIDDAFVQLRRSQPDVSRSCLLWGDARPANLIVAEDGYTLRALLDWELAEVGPPAMDLAWLLEMNRMRTVGAGVLPLPGFLSDEASVAEYERRSGHAVEQLAWYRCFSALKMAVLMHRFLRVSVHRGRLDAGHRVLADTVASRRVAELLGGM